MSDVSKQPKRIILEMGRDGAPRMGLFGGDGKLVFKAPQPGKP